MQTRTYHRLEECWTDPSADAHRRLLLHRDVGDYRISLAEYDLPRIETPHAYAWGSVELVLRGTGLEDYGGRRRAWSPGTVFLYRPYTPHFTVRQRGAMRVCQIRVPAGPAADALPDDEPEEAEVHRLAVLVYRALRELPHGGEGADDALRAICDELVAPPAPVRPPRWGDDVDAILRERVHAPPSLADVAARVGLHRSHLARAFRRWRGCTMGEYVRRLRAGRAMRQLARTSLPLRSIAHLSGYADQSHFTREFRRIFGTTPGAFRRDLAA